MLTIKKIPYLLPLTVLVCWMLTSIQTPVYAVSQASQVARMSFYDEAYFKRYDKVISLSFQKIKIRALLQLMSQSVGANIVVADDISGSMSIHVNKVPWYQAMKVILVTQGLGLKHFGKIWQIARRETFIASELKELEFSKRLSVLTPIESAVIKLHYANAVKMTEMIRKTLYGNTRLNNEANRVYFNERTNSIWVRDTKFNINQVRALVKKLDVPVKQINIEAKILSVKVDDSEEVGAQFGITGRKSGVTGSLTGSNGIKETGAIPSIVDRLNFSAPVVSTVAKPAASLALAQFDVTKNTFLDLQLSLMAEEGLIKVISNPRLITTDNNKAEIITGEDIPYQESASSGATTIDFKKAVLGLEVLPQVTRGNKVILNIKINEDKRGTAEFNGEPAIDTREIKTSVLMKSGDTIVIGGIYRNTHTTKVNRVPFFSDIPLIGRFFKRDTDVVGREELVILLRPKFNYRHLSSHGPKNKHFKLKMDLPYYHAGTA